MVRKTFSFNLEEDFISRLDQFVIRPTSRSDILNDLIQYALDNEPYLTAIVNNKLDSIKSHVESIERESMLLHDVSNADLMQVSDQEPTLKA